MRHWKNAYLELMASLNMLILTSINILVLELDIPVLILALDTETDLIEKDFFTH